MSDTPDTPFADLSLPLERQTPRASFVRALRVDLLAALDLTETPVPAVDLPERKPMTLAATTPTNPPIATVAVPYLSLSDASGAIDWYAEAFGAVEEFRVVGPDGTVGHAQILIGEARFMLSDEYPNMGVVSPTTLGGTATAMHLTVSDVDALFARAVAAGATAQSEPEDQDHGSRHGTLLDPYGHRWMLSQDLEEFDLDAYRERSDTGGEWRVQAATTSAASSEFVGAVWTQIVFEDFDRGLDLLTRVFGFTEQIVVRDPDDPTKVVHSQFRAPAGGVLQAGTPDPENPYAVAPGAQRLYIVTPEPQSIWERCLAEGIEIVRAIEEPDYSPGSLVFGVRDAEGNVFSFGSYGGEG